MLLSKLFFSNEIRNIQQPHMSMDLNEGEINLAKQLIENMTQTFHPEIYHDEYTEKLKTAIEQKIEGKEITNINELPDDNIINLMEALKESVSKTDRAL